jgi:uncharacterized delta-60 repeat protein
MHLSSLNAIGSFMRVLSDIFYKLIPRRGVSAILAKSVMAMAAGVVVSSALMGCGGGSTAAVNLAGNLDASYGRASDGTPDGMVNISLGNGNDTTAATALQADGKLLVVGTSTSTISGTTSKNMVVERFNTDGTLDATFGAGNSDGSPDGVVSISLGDGDDEGVGIVVQTDGKIVVVGTSTSISGDASSNMVIVRLLSSGAFDNSFGTANDGSPDGVVNLSLGNGNDVANAVTLQADGKIVVVGTNTDSGSSNVAIARLNTDGSLDTGFGAGTGDGTPDGAVSVSLGAGNDVGSAVAMQADGKIVVAGTSTSVGVSSSNIVLLRLTANGTLDSSFGTSNDGTPDGVVNLSLGDGNDVANALKIQPDGKLVVVGTTVNAGSSNMAVARLNTDGSLDTTFGTSNDGTPDGVVSLSLGSGDDVARALAIQADGKMVIAGTTSSTGSTSNAVVVRLNADGSLDASFGQSDDGTPNGVVNLSVGDGNDFGKTVILQADGKILLAGDRTNGTSSDIWVARLMAN